MGQDPEQSRRWNRRGNHNLQGEQRAVKTPTTTKVPKLPETNRHGQDRRHAVPNQLVRSDKAFTRVKEVKLREFHAPGAGQVRKKLKRTTQHSRLHEAGAYETHEYVGTGKASDPVLCPGVLLLPDTQLDVADGEDFVGVQAVQLALSWDVPFDKTVLPELSEGIELRSAGDDSVSRVQAVQKGFQPAETWGVRRDVWVHVNE